MTDERRHSFFELLATARYRHGARGEAGFFDCWGLTRFTRFRFFDRPLLPAFGRATTLEKATLEESVKEVDTPTIGCIVGAVRTGALYHTGVLTDGGVLEITERRGVQVIPLAEWRRIYREVKFYD